MSFWTVRWATVRGGKDWKTFARAIQIATDDLEKNKAKFEANDPNYQLIDLDEARTAGDHVDRTRSHLSVPARDPDLIVLVFADLPDLEPAPYESCQPTRSSSWQSVEELQGFCLSSP